MLRFGVVSRGMSPDRAGWLAAVRRWDAQGFDLLMTPDHLGMWPPLLPLVVAAEASDRLRFGTHVLNAAFCNPAMLARDAAAADVLTDGRMELGFGAGYAREEFAAAGIPYESTGRRVDRLEHLVVAVRSLLDGETVDEPALGIVGSRVGFAPVQRHVPFMVGGNGDRVLAIAARHADAVHLLGLTSGSTTVGPAATHFGWEGMADRIDHVRRHAAPRTTTPELRIMIQEVVLGVGPVDAAGTRAARLGIDPAQVLSSPFCLVGSDAAAAEHLDRLTDAGIAMVTVLEEHADALAALRARIGR
jgi:probable F420-dependent oxidoreductase